MAGHLRFDEVTVRDITQDAIDVTVGRHDGDVLLIVQVALSPVTEILLETAVHVRHSVGCCCCS